MPMRFSRPRLSRIRDTSLLGTSMSGLHEKRPLRDTTTEEALETVHFEAMQTAFFPQLTIAVAVSRKEPKHSRSLLPRGATSYTCATSTLGFRAMTRHRWYRHPQCAWTVQSRAYAVKVRCQFIGPWRCPSKRVELHGKVAVTRIAAWQRRAAAVFATGNIASRARAATDDEWMMRLRGRGRDGSAANSTRRHGNTFARSRPARITRYSRTLAMLRRENTGKANAS